MKKSIFPAFVIVLASLYTSYPAFSQVTSNAGFTDPDSRKSLRIRINLQSTFRISSADDLHLYIDDRNKDHSIIEHICVQGSKGDKYRISAYSQKTRKLSLVNENGDELPFQLYFYPDLGKYIGNEVQAYESGMDYTIDESKEDCDGRETAALHFIFPKEELKKAKGGTYTADLVVAIGSG